MSIARAAAAAPGHSRGPPTVHRSLGGGEVWGSSPLSRHIASRHSSPPARHSVTADCVRLVTASRAARPSRLVTPPLPLSTANPGGGERRRSTRLRAVSGFRVSRVDSRTVRTPWCGVSGPVPPRSAQPTPRDTLETLAHSRRLSACRSRSARGSVTLVARAVRCSSSRERGRAAQPDGAPRFLQVEPTRERGRRLSTAAAASSALNRSRKSARTSP